MKHIYNLGIYSYTLGIRIASLFNIKARQMVHGWQQIDTLPDVTQKQKTVWFHTSSLGEFEQARPVLERFKSAHPDYRIWVTFFSPSGYEIRKNYAEADVVTYLPMDTPHNAQKLVELIDPSIVFFVKYDFWFNYLNALRERKIPTYIFSAIFRPDQYFFKGYGIWFLKQLKNCFTHLFVQNEESLQLLQQHGINQCSIAGDTRFDRVSDIAQKVKSNPLVEQFVQSANGKPVKILMAGSSWEPDEEYLKIYLEHHDETVKLVLAPHVVSESHIKLIISVFGDINCVRYSQMQQQPNPKAQVLIIDNIGMLSSLYQYADVAYIGGGWGRGIHNTLEAITFGKPVVFGPNYHKFQEAKDIIALGGGYSYDKYAVLESVLDTLLDNDDARQKASQQCLAYLRENIGSTEKVLSAIDNSAN